jgi:hypothetical protein
MNAETRATPLAAILALTFLASIGTGVFWHGLPFIAKHTYEFTQRRNLVMYALMGVVYAAGAFRSGPITRWLGCAIEPREVLAACLGLQAVVCLLPVLLGREWALWLAAGVVTIVSSITWPLVESYLTAGRHGPAMRTAIARFNLTWMPAVAVPLFIMAPLLERHGAWALAGLAGACALALATLPFFSARPAAHDADEAAIHVADAYPALLRSARVLLPISYLLTSAMAPILPYRFEHLHVAVSWETPSTATWMLVRVAALIVMWRVPFWHGRWGTLLIGALTMIGGFITVVLAPTLGVMLAGFASLGVGTGVVYYAALYYAMAVGHAEVDAGGTHEGLIGAGYALGPGAALAGSAVGGGAAMAGVVSALAITAAAAAVVPYFGARAKDVS